MSKRVVLCLIWLMPATVSAETADTVIDCVRANYPDESSIQAIELRSVDRLEGERLLESTLYWKPSRRGESRIVLKVSAPTELAGAAFMLIERVERDDIYMYLPSMGRVRRMKGKSITGKLWGTDFSYADIKQLQGIVNGEANKLDDTSIDGRDAWQIELKPANAQDTGYQRFVSAIDKATCLMLRTEIFGKGSDPDKVLVSDPAKFEKIGDYWTARYFRIEDTQDRTWTSLEVKSAAHDVPILEGLFKRDSFHSTHVPVP